MKFPRHTGKLHSIQPFLLSYCTAPVSADVRGREREGTSLYFLSCFFFLFFFVITYERPLEALLISFSCTRGQNMQALLKPRACHNVVLKRGIKSRLFSKQIAHSYIIFKSLLAVHICRTRCVVLCVIVSSIPSRRQSIHKVASLQHAQERRTRHFNLNLFGQL